jgi:hypothetical protein
MRLHRSDGSDEFPSRTLAHPTGFSLGTCECIEDALRVVFLDEDTLLIVRRGVQKETIDIRAYNPKADQNRQKR